MPRIRTIKPEFFKSLTIANLAYRTRLTFIGLWIYVDDHGRGLDDPRLIKAEVWPQDDDVGVVEIAEDLTTLSTIPLTDGTHGLIVRYDALSSGTRALRRGTAGKSSAAPLKYLAIRHWKEHQKVSHPKKSKYPPPPAGSRRPPEASGLFREDLVRGSGTGNREQGSGKGKGTRASSGVARGDPPPRPDPKSSSPGPKAVVDIWSDVVCDTPLPAVRVLTEQRRKKIQARSAPDRDEAWWRSYFTKIRDSAFCGGDNDHGWRASFDWAIRSEDVVAKVLEGNYDRGPPRTSEPAGFAGIRGARRRIEEGRDDVERMGGDRQHARGGLPPPGGAD